MVPDSVNAEQVVHRKRISGEEMFRPSCPCGWSGANVIEKWIAEDAWDEHWVAATRPLVLR